MDKIKLEPAFFWICPECGKGQFELGQMWEGSQEEKDSILRDMHGIEEWQELPDEKNGDLMAAPEKVICKFCSNKFEVDLPSMPDEDDDVHDIDDGDIIGPGFS